MVEAKGEVGEITGRVRLEVSDDELRAAFSGPAIFSNKFYATTGPGGVRIAFMEGAGDLGPPIFRTAVILPFQDALGLRDLLITQLKDIEAAISQAQADHRSASEKADVR